MNYETGKLGLSSPEIDAEVDSMTKRVTARDPEATRTGIAYFYLKTPQEIHRSRVLDAMKMAISCLVYRNFGAWQQQKAAFQQPWAPLCNVKDPKYLGTQEQHAAWPLTEKELDALWRAQAERLSGATIVHNVLSGREEGGPYHGIKW